MPRKSLLVVSTHSFVDLITNSSSELFVCDSKKSLDAVKELLATLLKNHDAIEKEEHSFDDVFGKIEASQFKFEWYDVPQPLREKYQYLHRYCSFGRGHYDLGYSSNRNPEEEALQAQEWALRGTFNLNEPELQEKDEAEYNRRWTAFRKAEDALWTDYGARKFESENELFLDFLKQNEFSPEAIEQAAIVCANEVARHRQEQKGEHAWFKGEFPTKELTDAYETFQVWSSWGITAKKGDIFVNSAADNTVPYLLMDTISSYLNADRYHLG